MRSKLKTTNTDYGKSILPVTNKNREWLPVVGFEDYYLVSDDGLVFSIRRNKVLSIRITQTKHVQYALTVNRKVRYKNAHALVMEAFTGPYPKDMEIRHLNGIHQDNRLENLAYGTHKENMEDAVIHGVRDDWKCSCGANFDSVRGSSNKRYHKKCYNKYNREWKRKKRANYGTDYESE